MQAADIAAYIGAAAWVPQIISWVVRTASRPKLRLMPDRNLSIGYNNLGPILNLNIAFAADRKDALLERVGVVLVHETGESRRLLWASHSESVNVFNSSDSSHQTYMKQLPPVALKVGTETLVEKQVLFQDEEFPDRQASALGPAMKLMSNTNQSDWSSDSFMQSAEIRDLFDLYEEWFWWRAGSYRLEFEISSLNGAVLIPKEYTFFLTQEDVKQLRANLPMVRFDIKNRVYINQPGYEPLRISWYTAGPRLTLAS